VPEESPEGALVAVTGGTGFIGTHLVRRLTRDGLRVRVLVPHEKHHTPAPLTDPAVELVPGDITDPDALDRLVAGARTVYHLAGYARAWAPKRREYTRVNVDGTIAVCRACRAHDVPMLLHVSTNLVEHGDDPSRILTEYQRTKLRAEELIRRRVEQGCAAVVVRPTRVFGPGLLTESNAVTRLIQLYRRGLLRLRLSDRGARGNYVYVEDLVDGMVRAAERGAVGAAYTLGGEDASFEEFLATLAAVTGRGGRVFALPLPVALGAARVAELAARVGLRPPITREWVSLYAIDWPSSSVDARRDLGYAPRSLREGIQETVRWLDSGADPWAFTGAGGRTAGAGHRVQGAG